MSRATAFRRRNNCSFGRHANKSQRPSPGLPVEPADAQYILDHTEGIVGFYCASSMERLPVEPAITNRIQEFAKITFRSAR